MEFVNVIVAAAAAFAIGAVWYGVFSDQWKEASGVPLGEDGNPTNSSDPMTYVKGVIFTLIVAGMMRHIFELGGIDTIGKGLVSGIGIGLFLITPWMGIHYNFSVKPTKLLMIDGGYATIGCAAIGVVLTLF